MNNIPENINLVLQKFINGVQEILGDNLEKIILYGSYARGDYNASSDIDIMILTNLDNEELRSLALKIAEGLKFEGNMDLDFIYGENLP